jgi:hypothetical protein
VLLRKLQHFGYPRSPPILPELAQPKLRKRWTVEQQKSGQVAQVVERSPEKAGVGGSTPSLATTYFSLEHVAMLLADSPEIVRDHYYPWVPALQKELERAVQSTWDEEAPIILADVDKALQGTVGQA